MRYTRLSRRRSSGLNRFAPVVPCCPAALLLVGGGGGGVGGGETLAPPPTTYLLPPAASLNSPLTLAAYTRRFFGGRHPLCGIGVRSLIVFTSIPTVDRARTADSRPAPGPLTLTSTDLTPYSLALLAAVNEACWAAKGVPFLDPRNPSDPELDHASTFPTKSVNVTMVLLKDAWT